MVLSLAGAMGIAEERIDKFTYAPGVADSGDLEAAIKTITATSEAVGLANRDYQAALTLGAPPDARLVVKRIAARLAVTIDSMTAGTLYCRVYVDSQVAENRLFDLSWAVAGAKLSAVDTHASALATIFNLLKDGAAHTFYFFFWVDAGNAALSVVQLWEGVGSITTAYGSPCLSITHIGFLQGYFYSARIGTGAMSQRLVYSGTGRPYIPSATEMVGLVMVHNPDLNIIGTVATDINYLVAAEVVLRSP